MKIYIVKFIYCYESEIIWVGIDEEKAFSFHAEDFEKCDGITIEVWENGERIEECIK